MLNAITDSLSALASSEGEEDGKDEGDDREDTDLRKLSEQEEPGWEMGTISKTVQHSMESVWQKRMRLYELTQPERGNVADYLHVRDMKYGTTEFKVPAVLKLQPDTTAVTPSPTTFAELMQPLDVVPGQ